jgi:hypothetical protein
MHAPQGPPPTSREAEALQAMLRLSASMAGSTPATPVVQGGSTPRAGRAHAGFNMAGPRDPPQSQPLPWAAQCGEDTQDFVALLLGQGVTPATASSLIKNGVTSLNILGLLQDQDLVAMQLTIGQFRLLQGLKGTLLAQGVPSGTVPGAPQDGAMANPQGASAAVEPQEGAFSSETRRRLGLTTPGRSHHSVPNFVTVIQNGREVGDEGSVELPDGSKFIPKGTGNTRVKLENLGALQWVEGALRIMGKMIVEGELGSPEAIAQHAAYIAEIARLGQKKTWRSVVLYDEAYRQAQAIQAFPWGVRDVIELRDIFLDPRPSVESPGKKLVGKSKTRETSASQRKPPGSQKPQEGGGKQQHELRLCEFFNSSDKSCTRQQCHKLHLCAKCGAKAHGAGACPGQ